ncbi:restriction endonuclease subunit S [Helicobacter fennelliae]
MQNLNESLQAKYPHLELAILPLSQVNKDNESKRIDSEYFKKEYLENEEIIVSQSKIKDFLEFRIKNIKTLNLNKNFAYLQISDINTNNGLEYSTTKIDFTQIPDRATYVLRNNDICISTVRPNRNAVALIKDSKRLVGTSGFCVLRLKEKSEILPEVLYTFCKTKFFIAKMMRANTASLYPAVTDSDILKCLIPQFSQDFQLEIQKLVQDSHKALEDSKRLYKEAQELLYKELELDFENPLKSLLKSSLQAKKASELAIINDISKKYPHLNISVRPLSKSLHKSGRLDSEYYQSKYDLMETKIKDYKGGYCKLQNLVLNYSGGFAFSSDDYLENGDLALIRINNIKNANLDMSNAVYLKKQCEKLSPKDKVKQGDILISMSGSIGLSCLIKENIEAMTNQRILKISIKDFSGDVLVLLLNSIFCKLQFERIGTGGVQTNISSNDILNILIPKINPATQEQIALKIQKSFTLRAKSKDLLESAKIKVEQNIQTPANQA